MAAIELKTCTDFYEAREGGISGHSSDPRSSRNFSAIFRTPNWEDFVHLAFSEIRFYGAEKMQIARRLRAMIVNLTGHTTSATSFCVAQRTRSFWIARSRRSMFYPSILSLPISCKCRCSWRIFLICRNQLQFTPTSRGSETAYIKSGEQALRSERSAPARITQDQFVTVRIKPLQIL